MFSDLYSTFQFVRSSFPITHTVHVLLTLYRRHWVECSGPCVHGTLMHHPAPRQQVLPACDYHVIRQKDHVIHGETEIHLSTKSCDIKREIT